MSYCYLIHILAPVSIEEVAHQRVRWSARTCSDSQNLSNDDETIDDQVSPLILDNINVE